MHYWLEYTIDVFPLNTVLSMVSQKVIQQFHTWIYSKEPSLELKQAFVH